MLLASAAPLLIMPLALFISFSLRLLLLPLVKEPDQQHSTAEHSRADWYMCCL
jgi:hypothetical protein